MMVRTCEKSGYGKHENDLSYLNIGAVLTTNYQYDIFGRLTGVVLPAVADPRNNNVVVNPTTTYAYDCTGPAIFVRTFVHLSVP
jgi:hypothetical protein